MHSWEKGEGGELEPALTRTPPGPICPQTLVDSRADRGNCCLQEAGH